MMSRQLLSALRRVPLPVLAHQIRRKARDRFAALAPGAYGRAMERRASRFPALAGAGQATVPVALAAFIGRYYRADRTACDDAARGAFELMGTRVDFGSIAAIDWRHRLESENDHNLWRMKLCQLEILHSLLAGGREADGPTIHALLDSFESAAGFDLAAPFRTIWSPYGASHRILAVLSGLVLASAQGRTDPELRARISRFLHRDAAFVRANVEHDLRNNHTERNLAALCLYGMACRGYSPAQARRLDREVSAIVMQTILADGMQIERSAMYQGLSVMALHIFAASDFLSEATRALAAERAKAAERAWRMLSHRDGDIALFNDSWLGETPTARDILGPEDPARALSGRLPDAGYARLTAGAIDVWMDAGPIGPGWNPGHGHADFLAVEVDVEGERLFVDPGTSQYSTGPRRTHERSAASHNGPCFEGAEPVEYLGCFKVGRLAAAEAIAPDDLRDCPGEAMGGRLTTAAGTVRRIVSAFAEGGVVIADSWAGRTGEARARFLIPAEWQLAPKGDTLIRLTKGGTEVWLDALEGHFRLAESDSWCRRYMAPEPAHVLDLVPAAGGDRYTSALRLSQKPPGTADRIEILAGPGTFFRSAP
ncbi:heparinase II/III family protein [Novosphingobium sp. ST904]|uniref:heparinase II/III family protein n=1 Tax=Novosphingobium sp. ST904 TaxID=1684385 RepID=UPI0010DA88A5|nr:heparinase II/III family protein [Novosphingobium sp. ST904]TCM41537.1 heparinase II/III-like protein [Novosphingobium sp. ST904]